MQSKNQISVELQEFMGSDESIANSAWTSSLDYQKKKSRTKEDVTRVVNLLADSKHSVPFETVIFRFWIKMPIQTDRQHMTHRIASHSGMSGRYRTMPSEWLDIPDDINSILSKTGTGSFWSTTYQELCKTANDNYIQLCNELKLYKEKNLITSEEYKRVREFYRGVLPQNNMTERVTTMNLRAFCNYYKLRSKSDAQPEIRIVSELMLSEIKDKRICPIALSALERNHWMI